MQHRHAIKPACRNLLSSLVVFWPPGSYAMPPWRLVNRGIPKPTRNQIPEAPNIAIARAVLGGVCQFSCDRLQHRHAIKQALAADAVWLASRRLNTDADDRLRQRGHQINVRLASGNEFPMLTLTGTSTMRDLHREVRIQQGVPTHATSISILLLYESGGSTVFKNGDVIPADDQFCNSRRFKTCLRGCTLACVLHR